MTTNEKHEIIRSYFESALETIFTKNNIKTNAVTPSNTPLHNLQIIATVGITGDMQGNLFIGCNKKAGIALNNELYSAQGIAADPMSIEVLSRSTLGELANQIAGRTVMKLSEEAIDCNITPPTVFSGNALQSELYTAELRFGAVISGAFGDMLLHVEIKNMKKNLINS